MTHFRIRYRVAGGHVHARVFAGSRPEVTHSKCGDLTFRLEEWKDFQTLVGDDFRGNIQFLPEDDDSPK